MKDRIHALFDLCLRAKEKGHDCFFEYSAHVDAITVRTYAGGWVKDADPDYRMTAYLNDGTWSEDEISTKFDKAVAYLKELIG